MAQEKVIETFGLTKRYRNGVVGVEDLSMEVYRGEVYGFLGSNGAGKTTTIRTMMNLLFPSAGRAVILGKDTVKHHLDICKEIGYIPSSVRPHRGMTGEDFLEYMGKLSGNGDTAYRKQLLDRFDFSQKDLKRKVKQYSSGMARKIAIIQAFQHRPQLVIMDEPTEGLDPVMQHQFYELLNRYRDDDGTVFVSSHHLREVEIICDRAGIIRGGKLVAEETIRDLLEHTARGIQVKFKTPVNQDQLQSPAWEILSCEGDTLTARVTGDMDHIIKLLAGFDVLDVSLPNRSLQDVFMGYYRGEGHREEGK